MGVMLRMGLYRIAPVCQPKSETYTYVICWDGWIFGGIAGLRAGSFRRGAG